MDISAIINNFAESIGAKNASILDNPLYISLIITFLIMFIYNVYAHSVIKRTIYGFSVIFAIIFLYHKRFIKVQIAQRRDETAHIGMTNTSSNHEAYVPIVPSFMNNSTEVPAVYLPAQT